MKKYNNKNYNYQSYKRKKRIRINKARFILFISVCLVILFSISFGLKALLTDRVAVDISMTSDLNSTEGESLFKLLLKWEPLVAEDYRDIQIQVNEESYVLKPTVNQFELDLTEPNQTYDIKFKAKKKGFAFSNTVEKVVHTFNDNERLEQSVSNLKVENETLSFEHEIQKNLNIDFNEKTIAYEGLDIINGIRVEGKTETVTQDNNSVKTKVTIPIEMFSESPTLSIMMNAKLNGINLSTALQDYNHQINEASTKPFDIVFNESEIILINNNIEHYDYKAHNFYAESLHINLDSSDEISTYQLINSLGEIVKNESYSSTGNLGIRLADLDEGEYFIKINELPVYVMEDINECWYTITRNGQANQVTLQSKNGQLSIKVHKVNQLPENVYDVLIDPGHGGLDGGTVANNLTEAQEVLKLSKYIADRLKDHGLKVKLTRTEDLDPAGAGNVDNGKSPYFDEGRVEQVYRYQTKYMISNHLNAFNGALEGFEVYSSVVSDDDRGSKVASTLTEAGQEARDSEKSEFRVSEGSYKKYFLCKDSSYATEYGCSNDYMDYLYIIRDTGGRVSQSTTLPDYNDNYTTIPNYGAETILIEYAYIDNSKDSKDWIANWEKWGEAIVKATVDYLGITYQK